MTSPWLITRHVNFFCLGLYLMPKAYSVTIFLFELWTEEELLGFICNGQKWLTRGLREPKIAQD